MYRKIRKTLGVLLIVSAIILTQIPYPKAKAYQADFKMDGTTLVRYTGTAETVSVPASVEVIGEEAFADCGQRRTGTRNAAGPVRRFRKRKISVGKDPQHPGSKNASAAVREVNNGRTGR